MRYRSVIRAVRETADTAPALLADRFLILCDQNATIIARAGSPSLLSYLTELLVTPGFRCEPLRPHDPDRVQIGDALAIGRPLELGRETLIALLGARRSDAEEPVWDDSALILLECIRAKSEWHEQEHARQQFSADRAKLETFHTLTSELSELSSPDSILATVTARVTDLMDAGTTIVYGLNPSATKLVPLAGHNIPPEELRKVRHEIEIDENFVAGAHSTGHIRFCDDLDAPEGTEPVPALQELGLKSALVCPIRTADQSLGVMVVGRYLKRPFDASRAEVLAFTAHQIALILDNARLQLQLTQRLHAIDKELSLAKEMQALMLPSAPLEAEGVSVLGRSWPAKAVGGDYFDYAVAGEYLNIVVADIMGKGVSAALLMSILRSHIRTVWDASPGLTAKSVAQLSQLVHRDFQPHRSFVTVLLINIHLASRELSLFMAGSHAPLLVRGTALSEPFTRRAPVMGLLNQAPAPDLIHHMTLAPGDTLLAYTDGVPDTVGERRERFGGERLKRSFEAACRRSEAPAEIAGAVEGDIRRFTVEQADDTTLCVVRVNPRLTA